MDTGKEQPCYSGYLARFTILCFFVFRMLVMILKVLRKLELEESLFRQVCTPESPKVCSWKSKQACTPKSKLVFTWKSKKLP